MALDATARFRVLAQWMRENVEGTGTLEKDDIAAAVGAIDDWIDANQSSFNTALPQPFRSAASTPMKASLFGYVLWRRINHLHAEEDG